MTAPDYTYRADWLGPGNYSEGVNLWSGPSTAYLRRAPEVLAADEMVRAMVAAAYEAAMKEVGRYASRYPPGSDGRNTFVMLADSFGAAATQDQKAALSRLLAEARVAALEEAAREARGFDGFAEGAATWPSSIARRIEKLKGPTP